MTDKTVKQQKDETVNEAIPEFMTEIVDDLEYVPRNERFGRAGRLKRKHNSKWLLVIASGVLLLIVVLAIVFDNEEKPTREAVSPLTAGFERIEARLDALEAKIARMEESGGLGLHEKKVRSESGTQYHTVRPGETLSVIAEKYGITVDRLCRLNQLKVDQPIRPGQKLRVSQS